MSPLLTVVIAGAVTYTTRLSFIAAHGRLQVPEWFTRAMTFVPVAVLSAIILPELVARDGEFVLSVASWRILAGASATLIAWRTKNVWLTIAAGMAALWLLQAIP
ncbi:MAG: AzlD domain-containing protein [Chloroflexi bacterium]|nr:AzlD domain-containing protein [Chloroflexota bacterium]